MRGVIGLTAGAFDLMHAGHVHFLREARSRCSRLIVCLQTSFADRPNKGPMKQTVYERWSVLESCKHVDGIVPYETEADFLNLLKTTQHDVRFLGSEYAVNTEDVTGYDLYHLTREAGVVERDFDSFSRRVDSGDKKFICFIPRDHDWSSSKIRRAIE